MSEDSTRQSSAEEVEYEVVDDQSGSVQELGGVAKRNFPSWPDLFMLAGVFALSVIAAQAIMVVMIKMYGFSIADYSAAIMDAGVPLPSEMARVMPSIMCVVYMVQMIPAIIFLLVQRMRLGLKLGLHFSPKRVDSRLILWGLLLVVISSVVIEPLLGLLPEQNMEQLAKIMGTGGWTILSAVVLAPILEEILFRGLILGSLRERFGAMWAVVVSALLFGVVHGISQQVINAVVVGLILGYIYVRTDSLLVVMIIHAVNNAIAYVMLEVFGASQPTVREMISHDTIYYIVYGVCCAIFVAVFSKFILSLRNLRKE